jgi:hypothetical protein
MSEARHAFLAGTPEGLPRPRNDGMPVPWITRIDPEGPAWKRIINYRVFECQTEWICQVCGEYLPERAWVIVTEDGSVISDSAMHTACLAMAQRWCPHLRNAEGTTTIEIRRQDITVDWKWKLDSIADYGEDTREWAVLADE